MPRPTSRYSGLSDCLSLVASCTREGAWPSHIYVRMPDGVSQLAHRCKAALRTSELMSRCDNECPFVMLQVSGIILGMLLMGYIADQIGRKWGSVLTSAFMFIGGILLTCSTGPTIQGWAIMFAVSQFIFGYGVGGAPTVHHVM